MTYEQSLKNIEVLKNLVWPLGSAYIFFDFHTETEFKVIFFNKKAVPKLGARWAAKWRAKLPIAYIHKNQLDQEILHYADEAITYEYNLSMQNILLSYVLGQLSPCRTQIKLEIAALVQKLKNM